MKESTALQGRTQRSNFDHAFSDPARRANIETLLRAYPNTTEAETADILHFLSKGKHMDVGLVSGSDEFKDKVEQIKRENRDLFRVGPVEGAIFLLLGIAIFALMLFLPQLLGMS